MVYTKYISKREASNARSKRKDETMSKGLKDYWNGYRAAKSYIFDYGVETAAEHHRYGFCGNGSRAYENGFSNAIRKEVARLNAKREEKARLTIEL